MAEPFPGRGQQFVHTRGHPASLALGEEVAGPIYSRACENPGVDLTAVATPGYFGSMGVENWLLKRRAERIGPTAADYERGDTLANLAMGTASLLIPMVTHAIADAIAPQRSKTGKGLILAVAATPPWPPRWPTGSSAVEPSAGARFGTAAAWEITTGGPMASTNGDGSSTNGQAPAEAATRSSSGPGSSPGTADRRRSSPAVSPSRPAVGSATRPKRVWASPRPDPGPGRPASSPPSADDRGLGLHLLLEPPAHARVPLPVGHPRRAPQLRAVQPVDRPAPAGGRLARHYVPYGVLCFAGIRPSLIEQARGVNLLYQFWIHTDLIPKLGRFEELFNTASHHRVHHGRNRRYIDRNHGSILIVWDRLFGTFAAGG